MEMQQYLHEQVYKQTPATYLSTKTWIVWINIFSAIGDVEAHAQLSPG